MGAGFVCRVGGLVLLVAKIIPFSLPSSSLPPAAALGNLVSDLAGLGYV